MNCAQHPETTAVAYCRSCGKPLCEACKREEQGNIFCESCLTGQTQANASGNFGGAYQGAGYEATRPPEPASPGLALFLGFIPGVGAFYNGQYLKGFVHVIVMSTLIWMSDHGMGPFAGLLVCAWVFYMVFDAYSTAKARRDGRPIPDPLGLNAILEGREGTFRQRVEQAGERLGTQMEQAAQNLGQHWQRAGGATAGTSPSAHYAAPNPASQETTQSGATPPVGHYAAGPEGMHYQAPSVRRRHYSPVGAVVLIAIGILLLLANLGWFSFYWISRDWPVVLIVIGVWLFVQRQRHRG